jgi:maleamate amidohydrolase
VSSEMDKFFKDRGFGLKIGYGDWPALIVIDLVQGFTDPEKPLGADLSTQLAQTRRLLDAARRAEIIVYYTTVSYEERDMQDAGIWAKKMAGLMTLRAGQPEVEVDPSLGRLPDEPVITKKYASAFFGTDLLARLNSLRIDTLLIAGCTTSGCVRATAVDAVQNGLRPMVVREAVGDRSQAAHEQSLFDLQAKYADVVSADEVLQYLSGAANGVRAELAHE